MCIIYQKFNVQNEKKKFECAQDFLLFFLKEIIPLTLRTTILKDNNIGVVENLPTKNKNPYNGLNILLKHPLLNYKPLGLVELEKNALEKVSASLHKYAKTSYGTSNNLKN